MVYAATLYLWRKVREYLYVRFEGSRVVKYANRIIFWSLPPLILFALFRRLDNSNLVGTVGVLWAFCIAVYVTSGYLYEKEINIERVKGRFAGLRRSWFRLVKGIPLIGKRRRPFKALRGVSFEIRTGMFGLLGPNGAGKSTLMRIICGILEQSYGSIWINGLDTRIYREELQSLIGFLPQEFGTYENMSSWEFLDYQAILKGLVDPRSAPGAVGICPSGRPYVRPQGREDRLFLRWYETAYRYRPDPAAPASYLSGRRTDCRTRPGASVSVSVTCWWN